MDGLSAVASAMAIVSLAFQLVETAKQLCDFWSSIKDAPEEVRTMSVDLELLTSVLAEMAVEAQHTGPNTTLAAVLQSCAEKLESLTAFTNNLEPGFYSQRSRTRKWTAVKHILRRERLTRFQSVLESLKSTLVLTQQNRHSCLSRIQHETQLERMKIIAQKLDNLSLQHSVAIVTTISKNSEDTQNRIAALRTETTRVDKTLENPLLRLGFAVGSERTLHGTANEIGTNDAIDEIDGDKVTLSPPDQFISRKRDIFNVDQALTKHIWRNWNTFNRFFGTIHTYSTTKQLQINILDNQQSDDTVYRYEKESSLTISPAAWLAKLGLNSGLRVGLFNSSVRGWKISLDTFCAVPDDSLIFVLSRDGSLSAVRDLFSRGLASVRDTNSTGETPLHIAAASHHIELCRFLIAAGADKSLRSSTGQLWLFRCSATQFDLSTAMTTIRLFTDKIDFVEADGDGWAALLCIKKSYARTEPDPAKRSTKSDLFLWLLHIFSQEIRENFVERHYARVLKAAFGPGRERVARLLLELGPVDAVDSVEVEGGFTALQAILIEPGCPDLERILAFNPEIHHLGLEASHSPIQETPLSLALYASQTFRSFADALNKRNIDLDGFVIQELGENYPLVKDSWTRETLRAVFEYQFEPDVGYTGIGFCDECGGELIEAVRVEVAWQFHLKEFKERHLRTASETGRSHVDQLSNISNDTMQHQTSMDRTLHFGDVGNNLKSRSRSGTDCASDVRPGPEPAESETEEDSWERRFWQHTVVCVHCWQSFKSRLRDPQSAIQNDPTGEDNDPEDDFSPYLFNT